MAWIKDLVDPKTRAWEEFYRNRWQHDKVVAQHARRQLHRRLLVEDPRQGRHRHLGDAGARLSAARERACRRTSRAAASAGISYSWYLYSPMRVKYPYVRGALLDLWREAQGDARGPGRGLGVDRRRRDEARALPAGPRQGRLPARDVGRGARDHRRREHLHDQEARPGPHRRLLADSGDVDAQLRRRARASCSSSAA